MPALDLPKGPWYGPLLEEVPKVTEGERGFCAGVQPDAIVKVIKQAAAQTQPYRVTKTLQINAVARGVFRRTVLVPQPDIAKQLHAFDAFADFPFGWRRRGHLRFIGAESLRLGLDLFRLLLRHKALLDEQIQQGVGGIIGDGGIRAPARSRHAYGSHQDDPRHPSCSGALR